MEPSSNLQVKWQDIRLRAKFQVNQWLGREPYIPITRVPGPFVQCGEGDGAWFVHAPSVERGGLCYSVGVGYDVSFDCDVMEKFGLTVHAFDPTPLSLEWLATREMPANFHSHAIGLAKADGEVDLVLPTSHSVSFTPLTNIPAKSSVTCTMKTVASLRRMLSHQGRKITLLKLDIEGGEYDVAEQIAADADVTQVLIEFHHRMSPRGNDATLEAVDQMRRGGFVPVHRSPRGIEYVFLRV